jgi:MiaB/RimO family radical SAM methylthiotransferase
MPHADTKYFCLQTLGCKVNQYESRAMAEAWTKAGLVGTSDPGRADLIVLCSCTVTARAEAEGRRQTRHLLRDAKEGARVVVTGCAAAVNPDVFAALGAVPVPDKGHLASHPFSPALGTSKGPGGYPDLAVAGYDRARALVKIQDGCSHRCSYCIVPDARGASVSRPFADILTEIKRLLASGHREIGLTGINLAHYGRDLRPAMTFWQLVAALEESLTKASVGPVRLRLGSLDPVMLHEEGLAVLAQSRLVCPHLHISLQSADPAILTAMGRRPEDAARVSSFLDNIRMIWPTVATGLDVLTGFPGESEAAFLATADFVAAAPLTYAHVFPYSRRPGTPAAALPGQLPRAVKAARAKALRDLTEEKSRRFLSRLAAEASLIVALERTGPAAGTCGQYVDCLFATEPNGRIGELVTARPVGTEGQMLCVVPVPEAGQP